MKLGTVRSSKTTTARVRCRSWRLRGLGKRARFFRGKREPGQGWPKIEGIRLAAILLGAIAVRNMRISPTRHADRIPGWTVHIARYRRLFCLTQPVKPGSTGHGGQGMTHAVVAFPFRTNWAIHQGWSSVDQPPLRGLPFCPLLAQSGFLTEPNKFFGKFFSGVRDGSGEAQMVYSVSVSSGSGGRTLGMNFGSHAPY